jgi:long-chain acyl-CoA synthetase
MTTRIFGSLIYGMDWLIMRALFRLRVAGRDNLPKEDNFIVIANHTSYLDAPAIAAALGYRPLSKTYWAGDPQLLFSRRWEAPLMRAMHCYPLDERQPAQALSTSASLLARGSNIVWFPEGWRSPDGTLQSFLPGIGHLLKRYPISVVPAHIFGAYESWPRHRRWPRLNKISVSFGKPIPPAQWADKEPRQIAQLLRDAVVTLEATASPIGVHR